MNAYRISQLAERTGMPASTLRYYEQQGLLTAERSSAGYRLYDDAAVDRLGFIAAGKHLGLPLDEIRELLTVWEFSSCAQVQDRLRPMLLTGLAAAQKRVQELVDFAARLDRALGQLTRPSRAGRCDPSCEFLLVGPPVTATPVACLATPADRDRQIQRWADLAAKAEVVRHHTGARVSVPVSLVAEVAQLASDEQACCPFFDMQLTLAGPVAHLDIRAPRHASELLDELLGSAPDIAVS